MLRASPSYRVSSAAFTNLSCFYLKSVPNSPGKPTGLGWGGGGGLVSTSFWRRIQPAKQNAPDTRAVQNWMVNLDTVLTFKAVDTRKRVEVDG